MEKNRSVNASAHATEVQTQTQPPASTSMRAYCPTLSLPSLDCCPKSRGAMRADEFRNLDWHTEI